MSAAAYFITVMSLATVNSVAIHGVFRRAEPDDFGLTGWCVLSMLSMMALGYVLGVNP